MHSSVRARDSGCPGNALLKRPGPTGPGGSGSGRRGRPQAQCRRRLPLPRGRRAGQHQFLGPPGQRPPQAGGAWSQAEPRAGAAVPGPPGAAATSQVSRASGPAKMHLHKSQLSQPFSGKSRSESPTQVSLSGWRGAVLPGGRKQGPLHPVPRPCRRSLSGGSHQGSEGTAE